MSAADDFANDIRDALRRHGPAMEPGEPARLLHSLTMNVVAATFGAGKEIDFLETALRAEREIRDMAKRRPS